MEIRDIEDLLLERHGRNIENQLKKAAEWCFLAGVATAGAVRERGRIVIKFDNGIRIVGSIRAFILIHIVVMIACPGISGPRIIKIRGDLT